MSRADDPTPIETNQHGQTLGREGLQTRQKLMGAARKLLDVYSPVDLTAVSIAKEAGTSSASFYMYFEDVRDILSTSSTRWQATRRLTWPASMRSSGSPGSPRRCARTRSSWLNSSTVSGRTPAARPGDQNRPRLGPAFALASVLHAAMQRLACTDPVVVARSVGAHKLNSVLAHVIQTVFTAGAPAAAGASGGARAGSAAREALARRKPLA